MLSLSIPTLETERLILRAHREEDFRAEAEFYATDASRFVGGPQPEHRTWRMLAMMVGHWAFRGFGFWALEEKTTGHYMGRTGLWFPQGWAEREIGWTLMNHATGKGYATEAALSARAYAYDVLGWDTAISQIGPNNEGSKAVARRLGAQFEKTYEDPEYGPIEIWRHLAPNALENGGMEAYA
ncbi:MULTISPECIES: GNAT family N-acetyltransferase [Lentibacter]|jgi:RimJ/RimL family protein N-acetyltransferase|uniref:Ribosomal-protein-alanine N-acetyltransferase n=1 Tax=Lentibacter algarum TaxID=576131 RepID=A0A1H3LYS1_9RHOB|nr:GNAT family N-acetyltransferase [Lentibacter algarum]MCO4776799.1 GNAT family N-acetyltransferase [Lentibacter algarum]MCO4827118.1 GNAT family N-acetyltransferase [Lentibacter algarum]WIF32793.1 Acetyltransferase [Lentibacter algarum]SDY69169.1 ribosomal-protein-alanine N-acetyltransferase [Lentibacter algarum]